MNKLNFVFKHLKSKLSHSFVSEDNVENRAAQGDEFVTLGIDCLSRQEYSQAHDYFQQALIIFQEINDYRGIGSALFNLGNTYHYQENYSQAIYCYQECLNIIQEINDNRFKGSIFIRLGIIYFYQQEYYKAINYCQEHLSIGEMMTHDEETIGNNGALHILGESYMLLAKPSMAEKNYSSKENYQQAIELFQKGIAIFQSSDNLEREASARTLLASCYLNIGEYSQALKHDKECLRIATTINDTDLEKTSVSTLAETYFQQGNAYLTSQKNNKAIESYQQSLALAKKLEDRKGEKEVLINISTTYINQEDYVKAIEYLKLSLNIARELQDRKIEKSILLNLGGCCANIENYSLAVKYHQQGLDLARNTNDTESEQITIRELGLIYSHQENYDLAIRYFEESLKLARSSLNRQAQMTVLSDLFRIHSALGNEKLAREYLEQEVVLANELGFNVDSFREEDLTILAQQSGIQLENLQAIRNSSIFGEIKKKIECDREKNSRKLNPGESTLAKLGINNKALKSICIKQHRSQYRAAMNWLTKYKPQPGTSNLKQVKGYIEAFYHLCEAENWEAAKEVLSINFDNSQKQDLSDRLETWGYYKESMELYNKILGKLNDKFWEVNLIQGLGNANLMLGNYSKASKYNQQALELANSIVDPFDSGSNFSAEQALQICRSQINAPLRSIANTEYFQGNYEQAIEYHQQSLTISREVGTKTGEASALNGLGLVHKSQGNYKQAIDYYQQSLAIVREIDEKQLEGSVLGNIGVVYRLLRDYSKAIPYLKHSLIIAESIEHKTGEQSALNNLGNIDLNRGNYYQALEYFQQSLAISKKIDSRSGQATSLGNIGAVYDCLKKYSQAIEHYKQALTINQSIGAKPNEANVLCNLAVLCETLEMFDLAHKFCDKALKLCAELDIPLLKECQKLKEQIKNSEQQASTKI